MWQPRHTVFRAKDFRTPRSTREIWGEYVYVCEPEELSRVNSRDVWMAVFAVGLIVSLFFLYAEGILHD